jgi:short-subunit dehydrogenase
MDLRGKRAFITGAGGGIGAELARALASRGMNLVLTDIRDDALEQTAEGLRSRSTTVESFRLDVTDQEHLEALRHRALDIDVLINSAGVVHGGAFTTTPVEQHRATTSINLDGVIGVTHALLPRMIERDEAMVVNIASAAGFIGLPFASSYAASKWGVIGFGESLRLELAELGHKHVKVMHVCPGYVSGELFGGASPVALTNLLSAEVLADRVARSMQANRLWVRLPWPVRFTRLLVAALPRPLADWALRASGTTRSMANWRGRS